MQDQIFYVGQKAFIDKNGEVLILILPNGFLDFPGGKIQIGETDLDASFRREVMEETGLSVEVCQLFYRWVFEFHSEHPQAGKKVFLVGFKCKYIDGEIQMSSEHKEYRWVNKDNYREFSDGSGHFKALEAYFNSF